MASQFLRGIFIAFVIVCVIVLLYLLFKEIKFGGETISEKKFRHHFRNLHGDAFDDEAKRAIQEAKNITHMQPIDRYRLGVVHLVHAHDYNAAEREFQTAVNDIIDAKTRETKNRFLDDDYDIPAAEVLFIADRLQDFQELYMEDIDIDGIDVIVAMLQDEIFATAHHERKTKPYEHIRDDDPEKAEKKILSTQYWTSDPQNVHDKTLMKEFSEQFKKVRNENSMEPELTAHSYVEVKSYTFDRVKSLTADTSKVHKLFGVLDHNYPTFFDGTIGEQEVITTIWQRIHCSGNTSNREALKTALLDAICDCVEGGMVVCTTGRPMKLWQSLAMLDKDPTVGIVANKQIIRNEIIECAAKITSDALKEAPLHVRDAYIANEHTDDVLQLIEDIRAKIGAIATQYRDKLDEQQLALVIDECKSCV